MPNRLGCGTIRLGKQSGDSAHLEAAGLKSAGARPSIRLRAAQLARSGIRAAGAIRWGKGD
ncbi:MAG: hypothetical protein CR217_13525 [Beijerinckiaceae bacterium]|nr:MAG: hypothetical protein CR217_13525 [Beijerinckiaceae bacterium]